MDIPLGTIIENGYNVAIRNESKVTSVKDLANIKIEIHLGNDKWENFETCNDLIIKFEKMTVTEEEEFFSLCQLNNFLYNYLFSHTLDEVNNFKSTILLFKTLIDSTTDENWNPQKYQELLKQSLDIEVSSCFITYIFSSCGNFYNTNIICIIL